MYSFLENASRVFLKYKPGATCSMGFRRYINCKAYPLLYMEQGRCRHTQGLQLFCCCLRGVPALFFSMGKGDCTSAPCKPAGFCCFHCSISLAIPVKHARVSISLRIPLRTCTIISHATTGYTTQSSMASQPGTSWVNCTIMQ